MNADTFLEQFDTFAAAPNGVEQLRAMILQLAVQGKLGTQDPNDEPAGELFMRIKAEWTRLSEGKRASRQELIEPVDESMGASHVPSGWRIVPFGNVVQIVRGVTFPSSAKAKTKTPGTVACLRTTNVQDTVECDDLLYVPPDVVGRDDQWVQPMDILISMANSYALVGKVALVTEPHPETTFGGFLAAIRPIQIEPRFVLQVLRSPDFQAAFRSSSSQTTNIANISLAGIRPLPFPLPPLAEQRRIVAKVDQLLGLCDELAARQAARRVARAQLVGATLDRLVSTRSAADLPPHVNRLRTHFDHLFDTPTTIPQLRQTILQLAVQGQLVPQDPNDEPASVLIERIQHAGAEEQPERARHHKRNQTLINEDSLSPIPIGWIWTRLGDVFDVRDGTHDTPKYVESGYPLVTSKNLSSGVLDLTNVKMISDADHKAIAVRSSVERGDILFAMIGSIGNPVVVETDAEFSIKNVALFKQKSSRDSCPYFLLHFLLHASAKMKAQAAGGVQSFVSLGFLRGYPFPVPPLAEQKRIVAKVTELLSLCDALEAQLKTAESASTELLSAAVHHLLTGTK